MLRLTSLAGTHAVEPLGRCARRTCIQPGRVATTGRVERAPYQVAGTRPAAAAPGCGYLAAGLRRLASSVAPAGSTAGLPPAAALADGAGAAGGPLHADTSRPPARASAVTAVIFVQARWIPAPDRAVDGVLRRPGFWLRLDVMVGMSLTARAGPAPGGSRRSR